MDNYQAILEALRPYQNPDNRCPRKRLLHRTNNLLLQHGLKRIGDRKLRKLIELLQGTSRGAFICSSPARGGGYFLARSASEVDQFTQSARGHAMSMLTRISKQRKAAGIIDHAPQVKMNL